MTANAMVTSANLDSHLSSMSDKSRVLNSLNSQPFAKTRSHTRTARSLHLGKYHLQVFAPASCATGIATCLNDVICTSSARSGEVLVLPESASPSGIS